MTNTKDKIQGKTFVEGDTVYLGDLKLMVCSPLPSEDSEDINLEDINGAGVYIRVCEMLYQLLRWNPNTIPPDPEPTLYDHVKVWDKVWHHGLGKVPVVEKNAENCSIGYKTKEVYFADKNGKHKHIASDKTLVLDKHPTLFLSREAYNEYWDKQEQEQNG